MIKLQDGSLPEIAEKWLNTDEFKLDGQWDKGDVHKVLMNIKKLCIKATQENKNVFIWMSL